MVATPEQPEPEQPESEPLPSDTESVVAIGHVIAYMTNGKLIINNDVMSQKEALDKLSLLDDEIGRHALVLPITIAVSVPIVTELIFRQMRKTIDSNAHLLSKVFKFIAESN